MKTEKKSKKESIDSTVYIFHRGDMWYPIELTDDEDAIKNALCNPGTTAVENTQTGQIIWKDKMN